MNKQTSIYILLIKNSFFGLARYFVLIPVVLFSTSFVLRKLGAEQFGLWAIFGVITAFADLSDLGIASGLIRFVAGYWVNKDEEAINEAVSTVLMFYFFLTIPILSITSIFSQQIASSIFNISPENILYAKFLIIGAGIAFIFSFFSGLFGSIIQGLQRNDLWNINLLIYTIVDALGSVVLLWLGFGIKYLVINRIIAIALVLLINIKTVYHLIPHLKISVNKINLGRGKEIVSYSLNIFAAKIASAARDPMNKIILAKTLTLETVSFFELGSKLANQVRGVFSAMLIPILPASTSVFSSQGFIGVARLFFRYMRYIILFTIPIFLGLMLFAKQIIFFWIGPGFEQVVLTFQLLLITNLLGIIETPAYTIMEGTGYAKTNSLISVSTAIIGITISIILGNSFQYIGVVIGYCLARILMTILIFIFFYKKYKLNEQDSIQQLPLKVAFAFLIIAVVFSIAIYYLPNGMSLGNFILAGGFYVLSCLFAIFCSHSVSKNEIKTIFDALRNKISI